ncbi:MAG TPA: hypothetical protein VIC08_00390 [Cellvibrionaceae bacterium]
MGLIKPFAGKPTARPALWRLSALQSLIWLLAVVLCALLAPIYITSIVWAGLISIGAEAFWIWRSLKGFGDSQSTRFLVSALGGLLGKWIIIWVGLVLLWRNQPDLSVGVMVVTVFVLNTLAALTAPMFISQPR